MKNSTHKKHYRRMLRNISAISLIVRPFSNEISTRNQMYFFRRRTIIHKSVKIFDRRFLSHFDTLWRYTYMVCVFFSMVKRFSLVLLFIVKYLKYLFYCTLILFKRFWCNRKDSLKLKIIIESWKTKHIHLIMKVVVYYWYFIDIKMLYSNEWFWLNVTSFLTE